MNELRATLRLQFHRGFTLRDAVPLVRYFASLGISHIYASPLLAARPGSLHGYDVVDPTRINPELGGEPALGELVRELRKHEMGLILDIVTNHMAVGGDANPWWLDVLEWGPGSPYAHFFDIQWQSPDPFLHGRLLVPFLRTDYAEVLTAGEIELHFDPAAGAFYTAHQRHRFPLRPPSYRLLLSATGDSRIDELARRFDTLGRAADARHKARALRGELADLAKSDSVRQAIHHGMASYSADTKQGALKLHRLLELQYYRLASWRTASDDINWRRFFDVNELGGLRVEDPDVFEATHGKVFELIERGWIDGLRIDHVDGLANPHAYCRKLRRRINRLLPQRSPLPASEPFPIYVEKIIGEGERLPADWGVTGTTGYEFMNQVSLLQHDPHGETPLAALWTGLSGRPADFREEVYKARKLVLAGSLAGDLETVAQGLLQLARQNLQTRDLTLGSIRRALTELIAHFPVYRTYAGACGRSGQDDRFFQVALEGAREVLSEADWPVLDRLARWLGGQPLREVPAGGERRLRKSILARFQQLTSPAAAKAVEDTACYRAGILLSRYEVGSDPHNFSAAPDAFHDDCRQRAIDFPDNLLVSATHDNKRGEDTRARLAVLSERPAWFAALVAQWRELATPLRQVLANGPAPTPGDELILYQTLLGSWPPGLDPEDRAGMENYRERLAGWQEKALREAKLESSWSAVNRPYEGACKAFLAGLLTGSQAPRLRHSLAEAAAELAPAGALNSLGQCLLRMTAPGVPDLYQGAEFWDFSLVDPDNRRPVDYQARLTALATASKKQQLLEHWQSGGIKQWLIRCALLARRKQPQLFRRGDYLPLAVEGEHAGQVIAFARRHQGNYMIAVAPVRSASLLAGQTAPHIPPGRWRNTRINLPAPLGAPALAGVFSDAPIQSSAGSISVSDVLADFPVNMIFSTSYREE
ncbi:MAG: malto-oligosyltrehalose synthase [Porticoccaceae bacterium]